MRPYSVLFVVVFFIAGVQSLTEREIIQKQIEEKYGELYMGEPFLTAEH